MRLIILFLFGGLASADDAADLRTALEEHRWFDLRDTVVSRDVPPLYRFSVAAAFNDGRRAERELSALTRSGASREQLADAHFALYRLYYRNGRYRKAIQEVRQVASLVPNRAPSDAEMADARMVARLPELKVVSRRPAMVTYTDWPEASLVVAPLAINGQPVQFALDTGASISIMTAAEAKRLGMKLMEGGEPIVTGAAGERTRNGHYAVADRLRIGNTEIRNAAFLVLPDGLEVFETIPPGQQGAIGLPILLALQTLSWNRKHELRIGFPPARADLRAANLSFEQNDPITTVEVEGRRLSVDLDTGGRNSVMWPMFGKEFAPLLQGARKGSTRWVGADGAVTFDAEILPELRMKLAGFPVVLLDAPALPNTTVLASTWHYGQMCMDVLTQASEVTFDFGAMRMELK